MPFRWNLLFRYTATYTSHARILLYASRRNTNNVSVPLSHKYLKTIHLSSPPTTWLQNIFNQIFPYTRTYWRRRIVCTHISIYCFLPFLLFGDRSRNSVSRAIDPPENEDVTSIMCFSITFPRWWTDEKFPYTSYPPPPSPSLFVISRPGYPKHSHFYPSI